MASDFLPDAEAQYKIWLDNFVAQCDLNKTVLGLSTSALASIMDEYEVYGSSYAEATTTKEVLKGLTTSKNKNRQKMSGTVRSYAKLWKANPAIPSAVIGALGIQTSSTSGPVVTVTGLDVVGCDDGVNKLSWNRNGNSSGTMFIVEYRLDGATSWTFAGAVTKTTFAHDEQTPGVTVWYRIIATRAGTNSAPCAPKPAYGNLDDTALSVAA
jgi:hypothetical protein